jgi:hypothetical protein
MAHIGKQHRDVIDESMNALAESVCSILVADDHEDKAAAMTTTFKQFGDYLKANFTGDGVTKHEKDKPMQIDIMRLRNPESVTEVCKNIISGDLTSLSEHEFSQMVMNNARFNKRAGESDAKAFSRMFEENAEIRRALGVCKGYPNMAETKPREVEVGAENVKEDAGKAAAQLKALVEKQRALAPTLTLSQLYERVYSDPANKTVVAAAHGRSADWHSAATPT